METPGAADATDPADATDSHTATATATAVMDWRLRTFDLYARVRTLAGRHNAGSGNPGHDGGAAAHALWVQGRDEMFATHPASALNAAKKARFTGLWVPGYDPAFRFECELDGTGAGEDWLVQTGTDGAVPFRRLGTFEIPGIGILAAWQLRSYGGGIFVPFRDATSGTAGGSYGAGRYLLDTVKGAYLGHGGERFILDFNFAYNPSCAYDAAWACPLPGPDNKLATRIPAGEMYLPALAE